MPTDAMANVSPLPPHLSTGWGNEAVIFDTASGDTHYLNPPTLALYQTCRDHPGYPSDKLATSRPGVADSPQLHELTAATRNSPCKIGLLEFA